MKTVEAKIAALNKAIDLVAEDVQSAVALHQMYERCANAEDVIQSVDNTKRAWGFNVVRNALLVELVITLMRIHDSGRQDNASLENIMSILSDWRVRDHLINKAIEEYRSRDVYLTPDREQGLSAKERQDREAERAEIQELLKKQREDEAPGAGESVAQWLDEAFTLYETLHQDAAQKSLKKLRNWQLAHRAIDKTGKHGAKYGDQEKLLNLTVPLFQSVATAVNGIDYGFSELDKTWIDFSDEFWCAVAKPVDKKKVSPKRT